MNLSRLEDIEAREKAATARHQPSSPRALWIDGVFQNGCDLCRQPWPCDAAYLLAQLKDRDEKLEAVGALNLLHVHSRNKSKCQSGCRRCALDRILKGGE